MMRRALLLLSTLCVTTASAGPLATGVKAQSCTSAAQLVKIGSETISQTNQRAVNAKECESGTTVTFRFTGLPQSQTVATLVIWSGNMCYLASTRKQTVNNCVSIGTETIKAGTQQDIAVPMSEAICGTTPGTQTTELSFVPTDNPTNLTDPMNGCWQYGLTVDTMPPAAPTGLNNPSGERSLEVTWTPPSDNKIDHYVVFVDTAPDGGDADAGVTGACESSVLVPGTIVDPDNLPSRIITKTEQGFSASSSTISGSLLPNGMATVAVAAQDRAGNLGPLSETSCMEIVATSGYWDVYKAGGGKAGSGCSALGSTNPGILLPSLIALLGLRRTRRRS